jgi:NAD(P)-dependent dehydrogenase (short-subunit alcohol dehydrogenase family)
MPDYAVAVDVSTDINKRSSEETKQMGIDLDGKVAIVTGGARGIGKGMATALLKAGAAVAITDIRQDTLEKTSTELEKIAKGKHLSLLADGTKDDDVNNAVKQTADAFGRIDVVINNAQGAVTGVPMQDQSVADVMVAIESGFLAAFRYMKAAFPYLKESQGTVINFASQAGLLGNSGMLGYNAAKEAIRALSRTAAREWAPYNITVNNIIPGMLTEGSKAFFDENPEHYKHSLANIPLARLGDPEKDAGALVVFLASEGAHYLTGDTFNIDGGRCMRP